MAVLEELLLPVVEEVDGDAVFVAQIGNRDLLQEVLPQDGDLLLGAEVTTGLGHGKFLRESLAANPREGKFQFRPRQNSLFMKHPLQLVFQIVQSRGRPVVRFSRASLWKRSA